MKSRFKKAPPPKPKMKPRPKGLHRPGKTKQGIRIVGAKPRSTIEAKPAKVAAAPARKGVDKDAVKRQVDKALKKVRDVSDTTRKMLTGYLDVYEEAAKDKEKHSARCSELKGKIGANLVEIKSCIKDDEYTDEQMRKKAVGLEADIERWEASLGEAETQLEAAKATMKDAMVDLRKAIGDLRDGNLLFDPNTGEAKATKPESVGKDSSSASPSPSAPTSDSTPAAPAPLPTKPYDNMKTKDLDIPEAIRVALMREGLETVRLIRAYQARAMGNVSGCLTTIQGVTPGGEAAFEKLLAKLDAGFNPPKTAEKSEVEEPEPVGAGST